MRGRPVDVVWIADLWRTVPVFHLLERRSGLESLTVCGVKYYDERIGRTLNAIPIRHARKFGRPCSRCFRGDAA